MTLTSAFGTAPRTFSTTDPLPGGLTLHANGVIDGTPTTPGTFDFTVKVTDALSATCTALCTIKVTSTCVVSAPSDGTVGTPYLSSVIYFPIDPLIEYTLDSGSLPPGGFVLDLDGTITGIPTTPGTYNFVVHVSYGSTVDCLAPASITINAVPCPDWTTLVWTTLANYSHNGSSTVLTPDNATGAAFHHQCSTPGWGALGPEAGAVTQASFTIATTGGGCNCNLHLIYALTGLLQQATLTVQIDPPGQASIFWTVPANAPGTYDIPFTLNAPGNVTGSVALQIKEQGFFPFTPTTLRNNPIISKLP